MTSRISGGVNNSAKGSLPLAPGVDAQSSEFDVVSEYDLVRAMEGRDRSGSEASLIELPRSCLRRLGRVSVPSRKAVVNVGTSAGECRG